MVILRTRNKITDFLMTLAWASPFKAYMATLCTITAWLSTVGMVTIHSQNSPADLCNQPEPAAGGIVIKCISEPVVAP